MKRLSIIALLFMQMSIGSQESQAYDVVIDGIYYNRIDATNFEVTCKDRNNNWNTYTGNVIIPSQVSYLGKTFDVTRIGEDAFRNCYKMTSITIPNSIKSIDSGAFYGCI